MDLNSRIPAKSTFHAPAKNLATPAKNFPRAQNRLLGTAHYNFPIPHKSSMPAGMRENKELWHGWSALLSRHGKIATPRPRAWHGKNTMPKKHAQLQELCLLHSHYSKNKTHVFYRYATGYKGYNFYTCSVLHDIRSVHAGLDYKVLHLIGKNSFLALQTLFV